MNIFDEYSYYSCPTTIHIIHLKWIQLNPSFRSLQSTSYTSTIVFDNIRSTIITVIIFWIKPSFEEVTNGICLFSSKNDKIIIRISSNYFFKIMIVIFLDKSNQMSLKNQTCNYGMYFIELYLKFIRKLVIE